MPIRVKVERVGYYEDYPDVVFHDVLITRSGEEDADNRWYTVEDRTTGQGMAVLHRVGTGVGELVKTVLEHLELE